MNIDDCLAHECTNGATCVDGIDSYTCDCPQGFWGKYCEDEVDECESFPCLYGGTCYDKVTVPVTLGNSFCNLSQLREKFR